jgi:hypothetical protein
MRRERAYRWGVAVDGSLPSSRGAGTGGAAGVWAAPDAFAGEGKGALLGAAPHDSGAVARARSREARRRIGSSF